jgi:hypothetical protein
VRAGVYLCREDGRRREELPQWRLLNSLEEWRGVVLVSPVTTNDPRIQQTVAEWGDAAAILGPVLLFGDPALVRQSAQMVRQ